MSKVTHIGFTGHRNRTVDEAELTKIHARYPDAVWVHGGAVGFDSQVDAYAKAHGIKLLVYNPAYTKHGSQAPLIRNRLIVDMTDMLIACYDGRAGGGTVYTMTYAKQQGKPVVVIPPKGGNYGL
jgi:hypothetical protein